MTLYRMPCRSKSTRRSRPSGSAKGNRWGDVIDEESLIRMATPLVAMLLRAGVGVAGTRERWVWRSMPAGGCESRVMKCVVSWAVFLRKNPCPGKCCPCARPDASHSVVMSSARWCVSWRRMMSYGSRDASKKRLSWRWALPGTFAGIRWVWRSMLVGRGM